MFITNNILNGSPVDRDCPYGFSMKFKNGWTVSVQWHKYAYSHDDNTTAEIAAWDKDNNSIMCKGRKWQTSEEVAEFIKMISMLEGE